MGSGRKPCSSRVEDEVLEELRVVTAEMDARGTIDQRGVKSGEGVRDEVFDAGTVGDGELIVEEGVKPAVDEYVVLFLGKVGESIIVVGE